MTEATDNSSLPMLLGITAAVVAVAVGGWFYLEQADAPSVEAAARLPASFESLAEVPATETEESAPAEESAPTEESAPIEETAPAKETPDCQHRNL